MMRMMRWLGISLVVSAIGFAFGLDAQAKAHKCSFYKKIAKKKYKQCKKDLHKARSICNSKNRKYTTSGGYKACKIRIGGMCNRGPEARQIRPRKGKGPYYQACLSREKVHRKWAMERCKKFVQCKVKKSKFTSGTLNCNFGKKCTYTTKEKPQEKSGVEQTVSNDNNYFTCFYSYSKCPSSYKTIGTFGKKGGFSGVKHRRVACAHTKHSECASHQKKNIKSNSYR